MDNETFSILMDKVKIFTNTFRELPIQSEEKTYKLTHLIDNEEKFTLRINRKGHRNKDNLTIIIHSDTLHSQMVRFDVNGSDHTNFPAGVDIPTPHVHIFTDEFQNGQIAIPLNEITDIILINELIDSLEFFIDYVKIDRRNINYNDTLL
ncbi:DUF6978 family protein [Macrococcoides canis]|uniref:DUF6978 family protein n=1 Tax=Macrococcoides canis TaxID=1855823 RepID=UPI0014091ED0|nr:hypothetical protein [Macrococcus canis]